MGEDVRMRRGVHGAGVLTARRLWPPVDLPVRRFLSNMKQLGLERYVIPFPATSTIAAQFLQRHRITVDLVHLDAGQGRPHAWPDTHNGAENGRESSSFRSQTLAQYTHDMNMIMSMSMNRVTNQVSFRATRETVPPSSLAAAHEYDAVASDLRAWAPLVPLEGVMLGDDYLGHWKGVRRAVDEFVAMTNATLEVHAHKWLIRRTTGMNWPQLTEKVSHRLDRKWRRGSGLSRRRQNLPRRRDDARRTQ